MTPGTALGALLALALSCAAGAGAEAPDVAAFTLSSIPVRAGGAVVHELDVRDRLTASLGAGLPADPARALDEARRRAGSPGGRALRRDLAAAAAGNALAARLGVERVPAVVVDGRYVVYGVRDVRRAVAIVSEWRARSGASVNSGPGRERPSPHPQSGTPPARSSARGPAR